MSPCLFLLLAAPAFTQTTQPIPDVWQQLASPDFAERETATDALWRQGERVRERLTAESATGSIDKRDRCRRLLWLLDLGVTPAMPREEVNAVSGYAYAAEQADKINRLTRLRQRAVQGSPVLIRLALNEPDPEVRKTAFNYSFPKGADAYLRKLIEAPTPDVASIAAYAKAFAHVQIDPNVRLLDAGVLTLTDGLNAEIDRLRAATTVGNGQAAPNLMQLAPDQLRLARLQAVAGQNDAAIATAARVNDDPLAGIEMSLCLRQGDPVRTRRLLQNRLASGLPVAPAVCLALRLAGDPQTADRELAKWRLAEDTQQEYARRRVARALMLAGDPDGAAELFAQLPEGVGILGVMGRWVEAFSIDDPPADSPQKALFDTAVTRLKVEAGLTPPGPPTPGGTNTEREAMPPDLVTAAEAYRQKRYADAVAVCERQLIADPAFANVARYLRAASLGLAGDASADRERLAVGFRLAARSEAWLDVIDKLDDLGLPDLAAAESEKLDRWAVDTSLVATRLAKGNVRRAVAAKDWAAAAKAQDRILLTHLTALSLYYPEPTAYVRGPYLSHVYHARAAWAAGDRKSALAHINAAAAYFPTGGTMAIEFVPKLAAAGETAAADALFDRTWAKQMELCRDYAKAARLRNTAAWTALRCGRHLDEALKLAEASVALAPGNPASLDTLAEALFRAEERTKPSPACVRPSRSRRTIHRPSNASPASSAVKSCCRKSRIDPVTSPGMPGEG